MKLRKILLLPTTAIAVVTPLTTLASCGMSQDEIAKNVVQKAVEEFIEIAKYPRPSGFTHKIRTYLIVKIKSIGYDCECDEYGNIWFDVPATPGYENYQKLILQGHMDMVVAGLTQDEAKTTGIEVEYHEDSQTLTSKDNKTSLGSDNGIGLGLILSLLQNTYIKHGPLRVIITTDEETGMQGAEYLDSSVLDTDYLVNLDGELSQEGYYRSCQGAIGLKFSSAHFTTDSQKSKSTYIYVEGFKGGHSGNEINLNRGNAIVFLFWMLHFLQQKHPNLEINSFDFVNEEGKDMIPATNAIPTTGRISFWSPTTVTDADINDAYNSAKTQCTEKLDNLSKWTGEDWDNIKISITRDKEDQNLYYLIKPEQTTTLIEFFTNASDKGIKFGTWVEDTTTHRPLQSCNISPLSLKSAKIECSAYGRAATMNYLNDLDQNLRLRWSHYFPEDAPGEAMYYTPWEIKEDDKIQALAYDAYKSLGIEPYLRDTNGGVEPSHFAHKRITINQTCLGTNIQSPHTVNETCYLKPLLNTVKVLMYIFNKMNQF